MSVKIVAYKQLSTICAWMRKAITISMSVVRPSSQQPDEETFNDRFSELATRNLFSWTYFTDGIRPEEKPLWKHEWLEPLLDRELDADSSESSSSETDGNSLHQKMGYIRRWQEDVSASAETACECQSST